MNQRLNQLIALHEKEPLDPFLTYGIALEHAKLHDHTQALHWLDKTLALDANYCYGYYQKAKVLSAMGKDDEARAAAEAGISRAKTLNDAHAQSELSDLLATLE